MEVGIGVDRRPTFDDLEVFWSCGEMVGDLAGSSSSPVSTRGGEP